MTHPDLLTVLKHPELTLVDNRVPSRAGAFSPLGVVLHHTAARISFDPAPSLRVVQQGRSDLPGPLCNVLVDREAKVRVITNHRANDTGGGDPCVLAAVKADREPPAPDDRDYHRVDGNPYFYDIEIENDGVGEPYSSKVLRVSSLVAALICKAHGWQPTRVIRHKDWTRRKIDPSWGSRAEWRQLVSTAFPNQELDVIGKSRQDDQKAAARQLFRIYLNRNPSVKEYNDTVWYIETRGYEAAVIRFADHGGVLDL